MSVRSIKFESYALSVSSLSALLSPIVFLVLLFNLPLLSMHCKRKCSLHETIHSILLYNALLRWQRIGSCSGYERNDGACEMSPRSLPGLQFSPQATAKRREEETRRRMHFAQKLTSVQLAESNYSACQKASSHARTTLPTTLPNAPNATQRTLHSTVDIPPHRRMAFNYVSEKELERMRHSTQGASVNAASQYMFGDGMENHVVAELATAEHEW